MALVILFSIIYAAIIWLDLWPLLRGPQAWQWGLAPAPDLLALAGYAAALLLCVAGWWWLRRWLIASPNRFRTHLSLALLLGLSLYAQVMQLRLTAAGAAALQFERLASDQASGYFSAAQEISHLPEALADYPAVMQQFRADPHPRSKPPGIVLTYWTLERLLQRLPWLTDWLGPWARSVRCADLWLAGRSNAALAANALMGLLTPILAALLIWPGYGLVQRRRGVKAAWLAAGLLALFPGRVLFTPHMDTIYPALALVLIYVLDKGWRRDRAALTLVAGLLLGVGTFFALLNGVLGLVAGVFLVASLRRPAGDWRPELLKLGRHLLAFGLGSALLWLIYGLIFQVWPWEIYLAAGPARHDLARDYWTWLPGNLYDFALFVGLPIFLLALRRRPDPLVLAFWLTFASLWLSGAIRGEVGRIWLFLAPFPVLFAAEAASTLSRRHALALLASVALLTGVIGSRWQLTDLEWSPPGDRPVLAAMPAGAVAVEMPIGNEISLAGFAVTTEGVHLYWGASARPQVAYTVFLHVLDEAGHITTQRDRMPQEGAWPTTCWQPGDVVADFHPLSWQVLPEGTYQLTAGLYEQATGQRLSEPIPLTTLTFE